MIDPQYNIQSLEKKKPNPSFSLRRWKNTSHLLESNEKLACHVYIFVSFVVRIKRLPDCKWFEARIHNINGCHQLATLMRYLTSRSCDNRFFTFHSMQSLVHFFPQYDFLSAVLQLCLPSSPGTETAFG